MTGSRRSSRIIVGSASAVLFVLLSAIDVQAAPNEPLVYPEARKCDQVDDFHGTKVADPYRWMEDPDSKETRRWIEAENQVTFAYLGEIPRREKIRKRLTQLWDYEKYGVPRKRGGRYFFEKNDGLQNQPVLYTVPSLDDKPSVLLDPNKLSADGTVALSTWKVSEDGKWLAYGLSEAGSDWLEWRVRNIESGKDLGDHLKWIKFSSASWAGDSKGFYYSRFNEPDPAAKYEELNYYQKLYYHRVGTPQSEDVLVYERPDHKEWGFSGHVTDDGRYLVIEVTRSTEARNQVFYKDLQSRDSKVVELIQGFEALYSFVDNDGPVFWFRTDMGAPRGRVIAVDTRRPDRANWKEIVPEARETLRSVNVIGDRFVGRYLKDAHAQVKILDLEGKIVGDVPFPRPGSVHGFYGKRADSETFYSFANHTTPKTVYRYDMKTGRSTVFRRPQVDFNPEDYETKQVFYRSKDGTRVPMFISHRKGLKLDGSNPTELYGYGGFNIAMEPWFSVSKVVWMEMGGVYAVANIRGGGEYGKEWHEAGMLLSKQKCFDDFIAAAEWLVANKYTTTPRLAISGASNGGLLVGACMTQRPDLFGACLPNVGVMDMLRFHKFTIGWAWVSDYGSPDNPEEFRALHAYSPLHNLRHGTAYPATLITTADHDDRVVPAHSFKFAAALQAAQSGPAPVMIRIETKAGHGAGKPTQMKIDEITDTYAFLVRALDMEVD